MPLDLTGIQNVGEFYSHHYLDALLENDLKGLFAKWRGDDDSAAKDAPDRKLERLAGEFFKAKAQAKPEFSIESRYEPSHRIHVDLLEALGYRYSFEIRYINGQMAVPVLGVATRDGHEILWIVETPFAGKDGANVDDASPLDQRPFRGQYPQHIEEEYVVPDMRWEDLVGDIFHADEPPRWIVLLAGRHVYLIDRTKWGRGQYLLFNLDEIFGRKQSQTLRAAAALLSRDALCPDDGIPLHDTLDESSHKHAYGVSSDLKYGLRKAVEMLANEYVYYQRTSAKQALFQDENLARKLTDEALIYMYRLLFMLYAEARAGELDVVPIKAEAYLKGYSLESLRDLELVPLTNPQAQNGYYIHESLNMLFNMVDDGHNPQQLGFSLDNTTPVTGYDDYGFRVRGLHSPLFNRQSTPLLSSVKFRNSILQEVIQLLSLSREKRGRRSQRGRISYAQLGINQLGAVYEALLSYSGFFASERMYEVKPADANDADETAQTYFIPESELGRYEPEEFVYEAEQADETAQRKSYEKGTFIFRLAGRDREKSASYYTPEVLTQCTVKYSLKELLKDKSADDILKILLLEPAMGSGAFANEGINQLADAYLERKQKELGKRIPADDYRTERQKVKYYLAVHNTYGVDLNPTAVELARVSLWLNVMYPNSPTPWFGARLATGNSLIGARRQVYSSEDVKSGAYASKAPEACPMQPQGGEPADGKMRARPEDSIYHWLLPDAGMAAFDSDKVIKELAPAETAAIKKWRKDFNKPFTAAEIKNLIALSDRADELWQKVLDERLQFLENTRQPADVWEHPELGNKKAISVQQCERELDWLHRPTGAYARMKLAMDYWCALWFWQIPEADKLPTRQQFMDDMAAIFNAGEDFGFEKDPEQIKMFDTPQKPKQSKLADLKLISIDELLQEPRLKLSTNIATMQRFHHWEIAFVDVFASRGGFDLIIGNPPWVKVRWVEENYLADIEPLIDVRGLGANWISENRSSMLGTGETKQDYFLEFCSLTGTREFIGSARNNPELVGTHANLYKCFLVQGWKLINKTGCVGFLHPIAVFDDPKGGLLRSNIYQRIKYHFQFINEFKLFPDVGNQFKFSVNIYQNVQATIGFKVVSNLVHPTTINESFSHDGLGITPGMKNKESNWDVRGHKNRIIEVDQNILELYSKLFDDSETAYEEARLPLAHSKEIIRVLRLFNEIENKLENMKDKWFGTQMFHETYAEKEGIITRNTKYAIALDNLLIQGPHFFLANPFHQTPKDGFKSHRDYESIDLMAIPDDYLPRTNFQMGLPIKEFHDHLPHWKGKPTTDYYRLFFSSFINPSSQRTLQACIFPPGPFHKSNVLSLAFDDLPLLAFVCGLVSSLPYDFWQKITGKVRLLANQASLIPLPNNNVYINEITVRVLRLNCLSTHFSSLWKVLYTSAFKEQKWSKLDIRLSPWNKLTETWKREFTLRNEFERRQALVEIDVLVAISLGLTFDELLSMYRVQFPVLQDDDRRLRFDQRGMEVPMKTIGGELGEDKGHPKYAEMVPPFTSVDREEDYRVAWAFFEKKLN
jgi:hypothetical protein